MVIDQLFGPWRPDLSAVDSLGLTTALNVIPSFSANQGAVTYKPMRRSSLYSSTTMTSRPLGAAIGQDSYGNAKVYAGCAEELYRVNPLDTSWHAISRNARYSTASGERWNTAEFGDLVIFTNYSDEPQFISKTQDTQFDNLTTLVKGRHTAVVRDFLVFGNTFDAFDGATPYRVRWSAIGNPFDFNFSQQTMSDFQDVFEGGNVQAIVGGEAGYILLQRAIVKMTFIGAPYVFQFDPLPNAKGKGCSVSESVISVEGKTFFLSDDGFYVLQGDQIAPIGAAKIDNFFLSDFDRTQRHRMSVAADPQEKLIYWSYMSKDAVGDKPDKLLIYHYGIGEWSLAENDTGFIFNSLSLPWTLEQLDVFGSIENVPAPFDSPLWAGGAAMLWSMDGEGKIYVFGGPNKRGLLETGECYLIRQLQGSGLKASGDHTVVKSVRPVVTGDGTISVQCQSRNLPNAPLIRTTANATHTETGSAYFRYRNRYHRFSFRLEGDWQATTGYQVDAVNAGFR